MLCASGSMPGKKERLVACPDLPSPALRGSHGPRAVPDTALSHRSVPTPVPPTGLLSCQTPADAGTGDAKGSSEAAPAPRRSRHDLHSRRLCPSRQQLGLLAQTRASGHSQRGRAGGALHSDGKAVARLPGWHRQASGTSAGSRGLPPITMPQAPGDCQAHRPSLTPRDTQ